MLVLEQHDWHNKARRVVSNKNGLLVRQDEGGDKANSLACKQALLFGRAKRVSRDENAQASGEAARDRGFAARSRVLARLASLDQIGELARRLPTA